jgi:hypothetical protein
VTCQRSHRASWEGRRPAGARQAAAPATPAKLKLLDSTRTAPSRFQCCLLGGPDAQCDAGLVFIRRGGGFGELGGIEGALTERGEVGHRAHPLDVGTDLVAVGTATIIMPWEWLRLNRRSAGPGTRGLPCGPVGNFVVPTPAPYRSRSRRNTTAADVASPVDLVAHLAGPSRL